MFISFWFGVKLMAKNVFLLIEILGFYWQSVLYRNSYVLLTC